MGLTVLERPLGHVLDTTQVSACIYDDYGSAIVFAVSHGLVTGDYVYIKSAVSNYNGFWYVIRNNGSSFYFRASADSSNVVGIVDTCEVVYQKSVLNHGFQCVHLPIIYKLKSDLWPTNNVSSAGTISSIADNNGLCKLTLGGAGIAISLALNYVKILSNDDFSDEVYQIISTSGGVTINRVYESGLSTSGTIYTYYNNYNVVVNVYAGLNANHFWQSQKPYELIATLNVIPDSDNIATLNIAEIVKQKIFPTENSTLSPYLPNNIDFFSNFYISHAETFDYSSGSEVVTIAAGNYDDDGQIIPASGSPGYTSDILNFEGSAVNSMLPFKNIHSGFLSAYIYADANNLIKFLTFFNPILFSGEYFDISFINNTGQYGTSSTFRIKRDVYISSVLKETFYDTINNRSEGIYRKQIQVSGWNEDRIDLTLQGTITYHDNLLNLANYDNFDPWTLTYPLVVSGINADSKTVLGTLLVRLSTVTLNINYSFSVTGPAVGQFNSKLIFVICTSTSRSSAIQSYTISNLTTTGSSTTSDSNVLSIIFSGLTPGTTYYVGYWVDYTQISPPIGGSPNTTATINVTNFDQFDTIRNISETKTITVDSHCTTNDIYLGWLNYLGGFEYWKFKARKDYIYDVEQSQITQKNIYTEWPKSFGEFANSVTKQIARNSRKKLTVRSHNLTFEQIDGIKQIRFSPLVQIIESKYDVTNVVVDAGSFREYTDEDKLFTLEFSISFTANNPSQFE